MRVIVCGGRDYTDLARVFDVLGAKRPHITALAHGGAAGADLCAGAWATAADVPCHVYRADWRQHGKGAGPIRNQLMLDDFKPDAVIAFPGGRGTADMVRRAKSAGVRVVEVQP